MDGGEQAIDGTLRVRMTEGEWAGWAYYPGGDPFEDMTGAFYWRRDPDGRIRCAFRAEKKHMNGAGFMHGGCLMTFADYAVFVIAQDALQGRHAVTAAFNAEFVGAANIGDLVECTGEVVKAGRSMVFVRGMVETADEPVMSFSAVIKKTGVKT